ncbi:MAG: polyphosphate polymerase domain-containing protein [Bacilli bacterium]|nr:polyphosphate polymerase domain-containing protein [Bacilli bacterium]
MNAVTMMQRYEMKFILTKDQLVAFQDALKGHMEVDQYGKTSIASIYYDTPDYLLIRKSLEKPVYKEKIRLRSYGLANNNKTVYLELKRKALGVVYKRRIALREDIAEEFLNHQDVNLKDDQVTREIAYFRDYLKVLEPKIMIIYDRTSYAEVNGNIRLTIDENPRYRNDDLNLHTSMDGNLLLPPGSAILEIKVQQELPLWLVSILSKYKIYKTSFSKVGEAYKLMYRNGVETQERRLAHGFIVQYA